MGKEKTPYRLIKIILITLTALLCSSFFVLHTPACAEVPETGKIKSVIEGMKVKQMGDNAVLLEIRGTAMPLPRETDRGTSALVLEWDNVRFPVNTDKKDWWGDYGWEILRIAQDKKNEWHQKYDYPLFQRVAVTSTDNGGIRMTVTGNKPLKLKSMTGMNGTDLFTLTLAVDDPQALPVLKPAPPRPAGDPLGMNNPVTLELRDVSAKEVFRMLASLRNLNLILDASVPDSPMTFSFKNTKFSEVFAYILRMNDLTYAMMGPTLVVGTADSIGKTLGKNEVREYKVAYAEVTKVPALIMGLVPLAKPPVVDDRLRTLYITATADQHREIENIINRVDHPGKQIMMQARLIEVSNGANQEIGSFIAAVYHGWMMSYSGSGLALEYGYGSGQSNVDPIGGGGGTEGELPIPLTDDGKIPVRIVDSTLKMLDAGLKAMESDNKGKILASPSVVALDGKKATIKLTHDITYQSGVDDKGNAEFSKESAGPTLDITPTIGRDGFLTLKLKISTGDIVGFRKSGSSETPETTKREVDTEIRVRNGELFVIGGLHQDNKTKNVSRVPILSNIPLLGELFKIRTDKHVKSEMVFIVVPYILDVPTTNAEVFEMPKKSLLAQ